MCCDFELKCFEVNRLQGTGI